MTWQECFEWTANEDVGQRVIHPVLGICLMASWPKASRLISAAARLMWVQIAKDGA